MKIKTKDLLTLSELTPKEFLGLINHSIKLKKETLLVRDVFTNDELQLFVEYPK